MRVIPALAALAVVGALLTVWGGAPLSGAWVGALLAVTDGLLLVVFLALDPRNNRDRFRSDELAAELDHLDARLENLERSGSTLSVVSS